MGERQFRQQHALHQKTVQCRNHRRFENHWKQVCHSHMVPARNCAKALEASVRIPDLALPREKRRPSDAPRVLETDSMDEDKKTVQAPGRSSISRSQAQLRNDTALPGSRQGGRSAAHAPQVHKDHHGHLSTLITQDAKSHP